MASYYRLKKTAPAQYSFNLHAENGFVILTSETYVSKAGALNGIQSCRENSPHDVRYSRLSSVKGEPYFTLKAANGQVIGKSEMYSNATAREIGIESVKRNGPTAPTKDETGE